MKIKQIIVENIVYEGVNHPALQGWDEMDNDQKRDALAAAGIISRYDTYSMDNDQLDDILHKAKLKAQDREDELSMGASGRRELAKQLRQEFELQRQQLYKEKMEMEKFAWEKANTEAERKHEIDKIEKEYLYNLRKMQMQHDHDMQKILHADTHELNKMKAEFNMRQKERQQQAQVPPVPPEEEPEQDLEPEQPSKPQQPTMWHTSQQVGYTPTKPQKPSDDDVTDVVAKPPKDKPNAPQLGYTKESIDRIIKLAGIQK